MARALIFLRPSGARNQGHVGWGFELGDGSFIVGAVDVPYTELPCTPPHKMGFWYRQVRDPWRAMSGPPRWQEWGTRYDLVKQLDVASPAPAAALAAMAEVGRRPWCLLFANCLDDVYGILTAYGIPDLPPPRSFSSWTPIHFFNNVEAPALPLLTPLFPVDITLYQEPHLAGGRYLIWGEAGIADLAGDAWGEQTESIMVRDGYLAVYAEPGYAGEVMALGPGSVVRIDELDRRQPIRSICASAEPFDPLAPPPAVLAAGTRSAAAERKTSPDAPHSLIVVPPRPHWSRP